MSQQMNETLTIDPLHQTPPADTLTGTPPRIGGWLYLPAIGLVLGILISMANFIGALSFADSIPSRYAEIFGLTLLAEFGFFLFIIYTATRFFGKRRNAPAMMITMLAGGVVLYLALLVIAIALDAEPFAAASAELLGRNLVGAAIWIPYFKISKRVKNTFVRP